MSEETRKPNGKKTDGRFSGEPGPGRPKGVPNKINVEFRETVRKLLEDNSANVGIWLEQVASGVGGKSPAPDKALDLLAKLAEYAAPKLTRTEHVGDGGGPVRVIASNTDERL